MTRNIFSSRNSWRGFLFPLLSIFFLLLPITAQSDELGEFLLKKMISNPSGNYSDASLLLITSNLKWYEENMKKLPQNIQDQVQNLRIRVVGESTRSAAQAMGEPDDIFLASGSCKPGRDIDLLYVGKDVSTARKSIESAILQTTTDLLAQNADDPLLKAAIKQELKIPKGITSSAMDVVASDLPNFGYEDLNKALAKARDIKKSGSGDAIATLKREMHDALRRNLDAQLSSSAKDMYRGGAGQRFFATSYLGDPEKVRRISLDNAGSWVLKPGGKEALSDMLLEQVDALMPSSRRAKFAKVASDFAMFFKHSEGGVSGTAKYVNRIWVDVDDVALLTYMDNDEARAFLTARKISKQPGDASVILAKMKLSEDEVITGVKRGLYQTVENQLMLDVNKLLTELEQVNAAKSAKGISDLEVLYRKQLIKFDLNDLANGLSAIGSVPGAKPEAMMKILQKEFNGRAMGPNVLGYIERQLKLISGDSADIISKRLLMTLLYNHEITPEEYYEVNRHIQNGTDLPAGSATAKLKQARQEVLYLSSVDMLELGGGSNSIDDVVDDWRRQRSNALIRTVPDDIRQTVKELKTLPANDLKALGWLEVEIKLPMETRLRIKVLPGQMADMAAKLQNRLGKQAISLMEWQRQTRKYIFSLTPTEFGEVGDLGPMDGVFSVATGLFQTYTILNSGKPMTLEQENLALANAWVTSLPIVGDFAEGILAGIDAGFTGNKRKALEAGLFLSIGVMGVVPGGQIPAMVTGLVMAGTPIAEGVYDARQAQNLVQAWVASGSWEGGGDKPMVLSGLFDRAHVFHELTYKDLLTRKGNAPYESEKADGLFTVPTINASIRDYAEKNVFPQYPKIKELRESLKHIFPRFNDKDWENEFDAKLKVNTHGGKAALLFFKQYHQIRTQALNHTIAQLKEWAEEEFRVAKDYEGEIKKAKEELRSLEAELRVRTLVANANRSAEAYSKVIKNVMEHETLPLSRYRIYKNYLQEYRKIAVMYRKINKYLAEVPKGYKPTNWHLTGYPEFDRPRITKLASMMKNGRRHAVTQVETLIKDFGFTSKGGYDPDNSCHKKSLQILLNHRYKIVFIENLVDYFTTLAESESAWSDAYESARSRYIGVRDKYANLPKVMQTDVEQKAIGDAVITFVAAMPYALASGERDLYRSTASDFKLKMNKAMRDYKYAAFSTGEAGKALENCLMASMKIEISLSKLTPKKGETIHVKAKLIAVSPPAEKYFHWKADGKITLESRYGPEVKAIVDGPGSLSVEVMDDFRNGAKMLAQASMRVIPSDDKEDEKEKDKAEEEKPEEPELAVLDVTLKGPTKIVEVGSKVTLSASVGGGKGPYQYKWSGVSGSSSTTSFSPSHVGDWSISLKATDAEGISAEAITTVRVGPAKVKIKGVKGEVFYGSKAILNASGMGLQEPIRVPAKIDCSKGDNPFCVDTSSNATYTPPPTRDIPDDTNKGHYVPDPDSEEYDEEPPMEEYKVVWQSEPALTFDPGESPDPSTEVTYDRMGEVKVWCELLKFIEGAYQTVAESEQITVNVVAPNFSISYEPANGKAYVGQQVTATIHAKPGIGSKLIDYRWFDPSTSNRLELDGNGGRISFKVKDINPLKLKALARVPVHGDELSEITSSYTGMTYGVNAWMVQPPNLPRTWDPKAKGLKTITRGSRATAEQITLKAELQGGTAPDGVRWKWTVNPGTAISNDISQTPRVSRSTAGTISARVTAKNKNGNKLGEATVTVSVIELVSPPANFKKPENPKTGQQKKTAAKKMVKQARDELARGDMVAAEKSASQAKQLDPKSAAPVIKEIAKAAKKSGWRAVNQRDFPKAKENLQVADRLAPGNADTQKKLKKLKTFEQLWTRAKAKVPLFDQHVAAKKPFSAQKVLLEMQKIQSSIPGGGSTPLLQRISDDFNEAFREYRAYILDLEQQNTKLFKEKNWQGILDISLPALNRELDQNRRKRIQGSIDLARQMMEEQQKKDGAAVSQVSGKQVPGQQSPSKKDPLHANSSKTYSPADLRSPIVPAPANPPQTTTKAGKSLKLAKTIYAPYEKIIFDFSVSAKIPKKTWVGMIPSHVAHGSNSRNNQHDSTYQNVNGRSSGQMIFKAPSKNGQYDLRMSSPDGDQEIASITFTVAVPNHTAALILPKKTFAPNEDIKLDFKASKLLPKNTWVGMIPEQVPHGSTYRNDQHDHTFQLVSSKESGQMVFRAPKKIGTYSFRMNETTNDKEVAAVSFEVAVPMEGNELILSKKVYAPYEKIKLDFKASKLLPKDSWVGLIPEQVAHGSTYRNDQHDMKFKRVSGEESGQMVFLTPKKIGIYSFRMNETTNDKEVAAVSFEVAVPMEGNELILSKKVYAPYEKIKLDFKASKLLPKDSWVGMIPEQVPHGSTYRNDQHDSTFQRVNSQTSGIMEFTAPKKIGKYGFRMNETTNDKEVTATVFEVAVPIHGNELKLSKQVFTLGEKITVSFKAQPLLHKDSWVGLIPSQVPHGSTYRNDQHDHTYQRVSGKASGQMIFKAPTRPGKYDFRMNEITNDKEVTHVTFTVVKK